MKITRITLSSATLNRCWDAHSHLANYTWSTQTPLVGQNIGRQWRRGCKILTRPAGEGSSRGTMAQSAGNPKNPDPPQFIILPHHHRWIPTEQYCAHITLAPLAVFRCSFKGNEHSVGICSVRFIVHHPPPPSSPLSASRWPCWNIIESPPPYITVYVTQADICCL